jgi:TetR/AcrR family transcriptional regulator, fatty acid metabolism regulator protein
MRTVVAKSATRDRIVRSALAVFARKGYHRATVDDIVRESGTSKGAVYHHFGNKEALFLALVDDFAGRLAGAVAAAIEASHGALGKVEAALRAGLETFAAHRDLARIILLESASVGPAYQIKRAEIHGRFAALIQGYLDQAVAERTIPPLDTRIATHAWLGAINELVIVSLATGAPDLLAEVVPALAPMLLRIIGAEGGAEEGISGSQGRRPRTPYAGRRPIAPTSAVRRSIQGSAAEGEHIVAMAGHLGRREGHLEVAGLDGAQDAVPAARRLHLDPRPPEMVVLMGIVGGDLRQRDVGHIVARLVDSGVRHLDRIDRQPGHGQCADSLENVPD